VVDSVFSATELLNQLLSSNLKQLSHQTSIHSKGNR